MWKYEQSTGRLLHENERVAIGYAGKGEGKNNADMQDVRGIGPLPKGLYDINAPIDTRTHGPYVMWLTPDPDNEMFGRSAFGIHGDSVVHPGEASEGCMIFSRMIREKIWESGDTRLEVI
jgi:hypothetical protein